MKKMRTSYRGRKCKHRNCKHILSIYNHEDYCHIHLSRGDRTKKPKAR